MIIIIREFISYSRLQSKAKVSFSGENFFEVANYIVNMVVFYIFSYYTIDDDRYSSLLILIISVILYGNYSATKNNCNIFTKYINISKCRIISYYYLSMLIVYIIFHIIIIFMFYLIKIDINVINIIYSLIGIIYLNITSPLYYRKRNLFYDYLKSILFLTFTGVILNYSFIKFSNNIYYTVYIIIFLVSFLYYYKMTLKFIQPKNYTK